MPRLVRLLDAIAVLKLVGYEPVSVAGDLLLDAEQADAMRCPECRSPGLRFAAFRRPGDTAVRGLAYCGACRRGLTRQRADAA